MAKEGTKTILTTFVFYLTSTMIKCTGKLNYSKLILLFKFFLIYFYRRKHQFYLASLCKQIKIFFSLTQHSQVKSRSKLNAVTDSMKSSWFKKNTNIIESGWALSRRAPRQAEYRPEKILCKDDVQYRFWYNGTTVECSISLYLQYTVLQVCKIFFVREKRGQRKMNYKIKLELQISLHGWRWTHLYVREKEEKKYDMNRVFLLNCHKNLVLGLWGFTKVHRIYCDVKTGLTWLLQV